MDILKLYYPNKWRAHLNTMVSDEDKKFNWFLCSKYYEDQKIGCYIAEISVGTKFYNEDTGTTYLLPKSTKIIVANKKKEFIKLCKSKLPDGVYGVGCIIKCNNKNDNIVCPEAIFCFSKNVLKIDFECPIISYAKQNYKNIRKVVPTFPVPDHIDHTIKDGGDVGALCKNIYKDIRMFLSMVPTTNKIDI